MTIKHRTLGVAALTFLGLAGCAPAGSSGPGPANISTSPPVISTDTPATAAPPSTTVASFKGSGASNSKTFTVPSEWVVNWTYDCSKFGFAGNFQIYEYNSNGAPVNVLANVLGKGTSGTSDQHADAGNRYLQINSECDWAVNVVG